MTPTAGQWAEILQTGNRGPAWLPFLVTAVHDADTVSGVAFSGQPAQVGWHRPTEAFAGVKRGERNREWREVVSTAGSAGTPEQLEAMMRDAATAAVAEVRAAVTDAMPPPTPAGTLTEVPPEPPAETVRRGRKPTA